MFVKKDSWLQDRLYQHFTYNEKIVKRSKNYSGCFPQMTNSINRKKTLTYMSFIKKLLLEKFKIYARVFIPYLDHLFTLNVFTHSCFPLTFLDR